MWCMYACLVVTASSDPRKRLGFLWYPKLLLHRYLRLTPTTLFVIFTFCYVMNLVSQTLHIYHRYLPPMGWVPM